MSVYLCNGLSQSMNRDPNMKQIPYSLSEQEFINLIQNVKFESCIGHKDFAGYLTGVTGEKIRYNRCNISVNYDDIILLASLNKRLPEHPTSIDYEGNVTYSLVRFEKQSLVDWTRSNELFERLVMGVSV